MRILIADSNDARSAWLRERLLADVGADPMPSCADATRIREVLEEGCPDVLFLDATLAGGGGLSLLRECPEEERPVTVVLADDPAHSIAAFEVGASGFLLWPVQAERWAACLQRVALEVRRRGTRPPPTASGSRVLGGASTDRLVLRQGERFLFRAVDELECAEAERNYVNLVFADGTSRVRMPLGELERRLDPGAFVRVHRSVIVNRRHIVAIEVVDGGELNIVLRGRRRLPTGRSYRAAVRGLLACTG
jgi:two-component system, LytTR family, response regulator